MDWDKLKVGDDAAWTDAGKKLIPFAKRAVRGQCPGLSDDEVNGVAIETLLEIIDSIDTINSENDLWGRLFSCSKRRAIDQTRRKDRKRNPLTKADSIDAGQEAGYDPPDEGTNPPVKN